MHFHFKTKKTMPRLRLDLTNEECQFYKKYWSMAPVKDGVLPASVVSKLLSKSGLPVVRVVHLILE